jgi:hypothetical protein
MRKVMTAGVGMALLAGVAVSAQAPGVREVTASARGVVTLNTKVRYTTMVVLPDGEEIVDVICGDQDFWVISATHNIAHVKPAKEGAQTNLNLVATSGAIYSFLLVEGKLPPDLKVYVNAGDLVQTGKPKYFTAAHVDALEQEVQQAHAAVDAAQQLAQKTATSVQAQAPLAMVFPYDQVPYKVPFLIRSMWTVGDLTYIRTDASELPALYEMKDGQPALVNFQVPSKGIYVVPKILSSGYFQLGKERLAFRARN